MTINRSLLFLVAALICMVIAVLLETSVFNGGDWQAWMLGGFIAFIAAHLP